jgi:membrane fusion protein (multidrug efflux system)
VAAFEQAKADVESATAALETANINLKYSTVTAPISGRTSRSTVTAGALVTAGQADALTTVQLDPIYVDVTQSSTDLLRLKRQMADGSLKKWRWPGQGRPDPAGRHQVRRIGQAAVRRRVRRSDHRQRGLARAVPEPERRIAARHVRARLETGVDENAITVPQRA